MAKTFVSYRRVSTAKQGNSGLGLEAQANIINYFVERENGEIVADFSEVHSGKDLNECKQLQQAIRCAKKNNAVLILAKADRFRNCQQALEVLDRMGDGNLLCCNIPHTDRFTLTLFFALAERERLITSLRTKQALKVKKEHGELLGSPIFVAKEKETKKQRKERESKAQAIRETASKNAAIRHRETADSNEANRKAYAAIQGREGSLQSLAEYLNSNGFRTSKDGEWSRMAVKRLIERYN